MKEECQEDLMNRFANYIQAKHAATSPITNVLELTVHIT